MSTRVIFLSFSSVFFNNFQTANWHHFSSQSAGKTHKTCISSQIHTNNLHTSFHPDTHHCKAYYCSSRRGFQQDVSGARCTMSPASTSRSSTVYGPEDPSGSACEACWIHRSRCACASVPERLSDHGEVGEEAMETKRVWIYHHCQKWRCLTAIFVFGSFSFLGFRWFSIGFDPRRRTEGGIDGSHLWCVGYCWWWWCNRVLTVVEVVVEVEMSCKISTDWYRTWW